MIISRLSILILLAASLSGCATLSKEECLYADWFQIGLEDGSAGKTVATLGQHRKACAKAGVTPNLEEYERGHNQGLLRYCNYNNGLNLGSRGRSLPQFCPQEVRTEFELGYQHGFERRTQKTVIRELSQEIKQIADEVASGQAQIEHYEALLTDDTTTAKERQYALEEMRALEADLESLDLHLMELENALVIEQNNLEKLIDSQSYP